MKKQITLEEWTTAISELGFLSRVPVGQGWFKRDALMAHWGVGRTQFCARINRLKAADRIEMFRGYENGASCCWYRLKPTKK